MKCVCEHLVKETFHEVCVQKALCLRHIHHIQAAPIHHIQVNALGIYQLIYAWQKKKAKM